MPPPDETNSELVGPAPGPPGVAEAAGAERKRLARRRPSQHEKDLQANALKLKTLDADEKAVKVQLLKRKDELLEQEVSRLRWDKYTRLASCAAIFGIVIGWLWAVRQLLVLPAAERPTDAVLITALGTTTVNVLGLLYIVARYLFPQQARAESSETTPVE